ncbi:MAG: hypothetical protein KAJ76_03020 [Candidatus Heimdallarchaeota archaeon]|nr:hypothetical protein [Candidatus Heimdallarchaeota archaeon]
MSDFEYNKMIEQIKEKRDPKEREELFDFIGENGDDRFVEPLTELIKVDDSPHMRQSLYATFTRIGTELAEEVIREKVRTKLPKDDGKKITKKSWEEAVVFLSKNLEKPLVKKAEEIITEEGKLWGIKNKGGIGIYIRNLLRNNGFNWGESALETYWSWVVEDALKKIKKS